MSVALLIVAAVLALTVILVVFNGVAYYPLWASGWRPRRIPPEQRRLSVIDPHEKVHAKLILGWPGQRTPLGDVMIDATGVRLLGGGPPIRVERTRVFAVRTVRWWSGTWLLFEAAEHEYGGFLFKPDNFDATIRSLRELGWPVPT